MAWKIQRIGIHKLRRLCKQKGLPRHGSEDTLRRRLYEAMIVEKHGVFVDESFATNDLEVFVGYGEDALESQETRIHDILLALHLFHIH